jgi:sulfur-carrier protein
MAVTVSIPNILRTHTGGEKAVEAKGSTLAEVIDDLDSRHGGIAARLVKDGNLHRFVNIYVDDEDVRFAGGLEAPVGEGATVTILPAVAGGATTRPAVAGGMR